MKTQDRSSSAKHCPQQLCVTDSVSQGKRIRRINLHLHTNVSDGALSPAQLIQRAQQSGLHLISITDHDTMDAYQLLPRELDPLLILPGMEISSMHEENDVHILALGCDPTARVLREMMEMYLTGRRERAIKMIRILKSLGMEITLAEVVKVAGSRELIVRPHIAQILVNRGYCATKNEAFDKYIGNGKPAFVPKPELTVPDALKIIHSAGGFALIAHPGKLEKPDYVEDFVAMGVDGLEVWHPDHEDADIARFTEICQNNGLYMTAGSDFHGEKQKHSLFDAVPCGEVVLESVNRLWKEYRCRVN